MCPALYLLDIVSDPGTALLIVLGALLLGVLLPMIGRPALTAQEIERGEALPRRGRSAGAGARSGAGGPAGV